MNVLLKKLQVMGYEEAKLVDATEGLFMTRKEAAVLCLKGSALLIGKK